MTLRGVIFDLDGTLVDSGLDFDAIRRDLGLPPGQWILEAVAAMAPGREKDRCLAVLHDHEQRAAGSAQLMPGASELLAELDRRGLLVAVLTRNSRDSTQLVLERFKLRFSQVLTRDDAAPKPDPEGLLQICQSWDVSVDEVLFVGDFLADLETGRAAGVRTVLYAPNGLPEYAARADEIVRSLGELTDVVGRWQGGTATHPRPSARSSRSAGQSRR